MGTIGQDRSLVPLTSFAIHMGCPAAMQANNEIPRVQIEYRFQFSVQHLWTSLQRYTQQIGWIRPLFKFRWLLALFGVLALALLANRALGLAMILGGLFMVGLLLAGWPPSVSIWMLRRRFQKSPFYNDEITFSLSESGAHVLGRGSELRIAWANFTKARRFADGLLLFQGPNVFNWLPDTAAVRAEDVAEAQKLARAQIQDYDEV
ncbi:MAG: YcxB family protein [Variovorax sp.]|nr:YcxB family protein [Variovorax sp.]